MSDTQLGLVLGLLAVVGAAVAFTFYRGQRQSAIYEKVEQMAEHIEELTLRMVTLELDRSGYRLWTSQLRGQLLELGRVPAPPPSWLIDAHSQSRPAVAGREPGDIVVEVYRLVNEYFNLDEIDGLALQAGIDPESFGGQDSRPARARELVEHAVRHGLMAKLVEQARQLRPLVEWPRVMAGMDIKD